MRVKSRKRAWRTRGYPAAAAAAASVRDMPVVKSWQKKAVAQQKKTTTATTPAPKKKAMADKEKVGQVARSKVIGSYFLEKRIG